MLSQAAQAVAVELQTDQVLLVQPIKVMLVVMDQRLILAAAVVAEQVLLEVQLLEITAATAAMA